MKLFCYVYEDEYEGLHGVETCFVDDFSSLEYAIEACREEGEYLVDSFFSPEEDEDEESFRERHGIEYNIYKIKDEVDLTTDQLDCLCCKWWSRKYFIEKYCDKTPLI